MSQTTLDFNALFPATYVDTRVVNEPILEDGYRLGSAGSPDNPVQFISYGSEYGPGGASAGSLHYNGPGVISNPGSYLTGTRLTRADGQPFDMVSIRLDSVYSFFETPRPAIVTFAGERATGGPVTATFTTDTAPGLQTFTLPSGFTGLTSVSWNHETVFTPPDPTQNTDYQQNQWDDIVVRATATPPPGGQTIPGTGGADNLNGGPGADSISGGAGGDDLRGLGGADTLDGGADFDGLVGGEGADRFILTGGNEWIEDFQPGVDKLVLRNGFDPGAVTARQVTFGWGEPGFEVRYGPGAADVVSMRGVSALQPGDIIA